MAGDGGTARTPVVRPARADDEDEAVPLLFESGRMVYERLAGSRESALGILHASYRRPGNTVSAEVVTLAEVEGRVAGVMAAFPVSEGAQRARRYMRSALIRVAPWRWPRAWRTFGALRPAPPPHALYVDALATGADLRRLGVASALLARAHADGRARGCSRLALETEIENEGARALYARAGFEETGRLPALETGLGRGYVCLVKPL